MSVALASLLASCSRSNNGNTQRQSAAVPVLAVQAVAKNVPVELKAIGTVRAYSLVSIRSQITGPITEVHFEEGQEVKAGDPLFTIDPRPYEAALNQARANLERDLAQMISARLEFERTSNLFESKIAAQQDYDTADASFQASVATVAADRAAVTNAQVNLGYTAIRSPIDGRTGNFIVKNGNVVKAPDDVLLTVTQLHPIYVAFAVPEQNLSMVRRESQQATLAVEAVAPGETNHPVLGDLTFINSMVDTNTGTILLKATFANTNNVLWPGQFVQVSLTLSNLVNAVVIPSQAVQTGQQGEFVFMVKSDQTVEARPIVTGITYDGWIVIVSGIKAGETVVTDGQLRLTPGAKISIKTSEAAGLSGDTSANSP